MNQAEIAKEAQLLEIDGEPLVLGVGTELSTAGGTMWIYALRDKAIVVKTDESFYIGPDRVENGDSFTFGRISRLFRQGELWVSGIHEG